MQCPFCRHEKSRVYTTENFNDTIRRYRECLCCKKVFLTGEEVIDKLEKTNLRRQGRVVPD